MNLKSRQQLKNQEIQAIIMKYLEKIRKPIPFLEDWSWDNEEQWRFLGETRWVWEWRTNKTMNSQKSSRENWKVLKTVLKAQNMRFSRLYQVVCKSLGQVAKQLRDKILKNLSKCFSWLKGPPKRKSRRELRKFMYNLATGASTRDQVAKPSHENL